MGAWATVRLSVRVAGVGEGKDGAAGGARRGVEIITGCR